MNGCLRYLWNAIKPSCSGPRHPPHHRPTPKPPWQQHSYFFFSCGTTSISFPQSPSFSFSPLLPSNRARKCDPTCWWLAGWTSQPRQCLRRWGCLRDMHASHRLRKYQVIKPTFFGDLWWPSLHCLRCVSFYGLNHTVALSRTRVQILWLVGLNGS